MNIWAPYISATLERVPDAGTKIAFARFHVARHLGDAVDNVRRAEHKELLNEGNPILVGKKWQWLNGPGGKTHGQKLAVVRLRAGESPTCLNRRVRRLVACPGKGCQSGRGRRSGIDSECTRATWSNGMGYLTIAVFRNHHQAFR